MDKIRIEDLEVYAKHGVFPEENVLGQKFRVSVTLYTDTKNAGMTDDLGTSIAVSYTHLLNLSIWRAHCRRHWMPILSP